MNTPQKIAVSLSILATMMLPQSAFADDDDDDKSSYRMVKVSLTNISNVVFTPPLFATCNKRLAPIARLGHPASDALEPLAEGGDTSAIASMLTGKNCNTASHPAPVLPGETVTVEMASGKYFHMASMLLPTNDGFIFSSGRKVKKIKKRGLRLRSHDAGTEVNDEMCANIPGPQCGGEGFNAERADNNFVKPHPGIQGFADVSAQTYNWGEPVALITIR